MSSFNPVGLDGIEFIELTGPEPERLDALLVAFGFSRTRRHRTSDIFHYQQGDIRFLLNREKGSFAETFRRAHGPSICSMGLRVHDARAAFDTAVARGARPYEGKSPYRGVPAVYGIGDSLIYLVERRGARSYQDELIDLDRPHVAQDKGFTSIDHLTNNVEKGTMQRWSQFYKDVFGFTEVRYFDIRGARTGLTSYALRSPCGRFCIPINEGNEDKSQIEEYLREYKGPGIQHVAFATNDLLSSLDRLAGSGIETLDIEDAYYDSVFDRVPNVVEDHGRIRKHRVLVDGDDDGYLLQIFTKTIIGPIFIELIQRKNHASFGEGNFGALFRSIERDQQRRGVL
jgi:4-hydroxyphenylpyruvate dioxygenase